MNDRYNVLLVADRADLFNAMPSIMNSDKYRVAIAANVNKAIDLIEKIHFDIVYLVDITDDDGREAYRNIKQISPDTSVLEINMFDRKADWNQTEVSSIEHLHIDELIN